MIKDSVRRHEIAVSSAEYRLGLPEKRAQLIRNPRLRMQSRECRRNINSRNREHSLGRTTCPPMSDNLASCCQVRGKDFELNPCPFVPAHGPPTLAIIDLQCSSTRSDVRDQERSRSFGPPPNRLLIAPHVWTNGMARTKKTLIATETMTRRSDGGSSSSSRRAILLIGAGE